MNATPHERLIMPQKEEKVLATRFFTFKQNDESYNFQSTPHVAETYIHKFLNDKLVIKLVLFVISVFLTVERLRSKT